MLDKYSSLCFTAYCNACRMRSHQFDGDHPLLHILLWSREIKLKGARFMNYVETLSMFWEASMKSLVGTLTLIALWAVTGAAECPKRKTSVMQNLGIYRH